MFGRCEIPVRVGLPGEAISAAEITNAVESRAYFHVRTFIAFSFEVLMQDQAQNDDDDQAEEHRNEDSWIGQEESGVFRVNDQFRSDCS